MVEHKKSCQKPEPENLTNAIVQTMDTHNPDSLVDHGRNYWNIVKTIFPLFVKFYRTRVNDNLDILHQKVTYSYDLMEQHSTALQCIHGIFLIFYGGSWLSLATWMSFCHVYNVQETIWILRTLGRGAKMRTIWKTLKHLWLLTLVGFAVWRFPLLANFTVAFMLEKYVTGVIVNPGIMRRVDKLVPVIKILGVWKHIVLQASVRFVLAVPSVFTYNFQVSLLMACIGYNKVWNSIAPGLRWQIKTSEGPFNLDGYTITLWSLVLLSTCWQAFHTDVFSLLSIFVPVGFLIPGKKVRFKPLKFEKNQ